jgi:hypothetical protein
MKYTNMMLDNRKENSDTLCWFLGFNAETEVKVKKYVNEHGTRSFLLKYDCLSFTDEEIRKIEVFKKVIEKYDGDIEMIDFDNEEDF